MQSYFKKTDEKIDKPCSNCGGDAYLFSHQTKHHGIDSVIACTQCGAETQPQIKLGWAQQAWSEDERVLPCLCGAIPVMKREGGFSWYACPCGLVPEDLPQEHRKLRNTNKETIDSWNASVHDRRDIIRNFDQGNDAMKESRVLEPGDRV